jgi:hypothetical protein
MPRLVRVSKRQHVTGFQPHTRRHLAAEIIGTVFGEIDGIERRRTVYEHEARASSMATQRTQVERKGQPGQEALRGCRHCTTRELG